MAYGVWEAVCHCARLSHGGRGLMDRLPLSELRGRRYKRAAAAVGLGGARPYDLRHSLASLLLAEQMNPAEIANEMGHTLQTLFGTYAHVIEDLRGGERVSAEEEIRKARAAAAEADVAQMLPKSVESAISGDARQRKNPA